MRILIFIIILITLFSCKTTVNNARFDNTMKLDTNTFNTIYNKFKEPTLTHRRFKHADIDSLIQIRNKHNSLKIDEIGKSFEGRNIYELSFGKGEKVVMLWSQMHGDEPTATMALFDLFNFLEGEGDDFDSIRTLLNDKLNIHFIPMLNPDGAERYIRRTAQSIDMNRDARAGHTVEGALLRQRAEVLKPKYGFNLHDQNIYYNMPGTSNPVSISLLAPAYNPERDINSTRKGAMQLAVGMFNLLNNYIPNAVAKYDDTYTPRGFGDNFQSWGASTVLIESGGMKGDPEKQELRKLNFIIILNALIQIAEGSYEQYSVKAYDEIPLNASQLHDVVLRNVTLKNGAVDYKTDVAIRRNERTVDRDYFVKGVIEDIGDLQESFGYDELDAEGLYFVEGKIGSKEFNIIDDLSVHNAYELLKSGVMGIRLNLTKETTDLPLHNYPVHFYKKSIFYPTPFIEIGGTANFYLANKSGQLKYAILNGYLIDLSKPFLPNTYKNRVF